MGRGLKRLVPLACLLFAGCDRMIALRDGWTNDLSPAVAEQPSTTQPSLALDDSTFQAIDHRDPRAVVQAFLSGVKRADNRMVRRLLSQRSQAACESMSIQLAVPTTTPLAQSRVFHPEYLPDNREAAHVRCLWSDSVGATELIFVLRLENELESAQSIGWRIAGLAVPHPSGTEVYDLESSGDLQSLVVR